MKTLTLLALTVVSTLLANCSSDRVYTPPMETSTTTTTHERVITNPDMAQTTTVTRQY